MARKRNYKAEYQRRKARGLVRGLSLSQARGHPKPGEVRVSGKPPAALADTKISKAIEAMNAGRSMTKAI